MSEPSTAASESSAGDAGVRSALTANGILLIQLDRPQRRNALVPAMVARLSELFRARDGRVVILSSTDPTCFCSGADLDIADGARAGMSHDLYVLYGLMIASPAPIIAAIGGPAVGGGAQLALAADIRIASPSSSLRFVGVGHGLAVGAWRLGDVVGNGRAFELCATMRAVPADEALSIGLVTTIADQPEPAAFDLAQQLIHADPAALARVKTVLATQGGLESRLAAERELNRAWHGRVPR